MIADPPEVFREKDRVARKPHECCECRQTIEAGTVYSYASGVWEGQGESYKTCKPCYAMRQLVQDWLCEYPPFGDLREWVTETVKDDKTLRDMVEDWLQRRGV